MADGTKMLQILIDGQKAMHKDIKEIKEEAKKTEGRLTERIDKLGLQLAELSDDAPTIEEFDALDNRVKKLEHQVAAI